MNLNVDSWKEFRLGDLFSEMYKAEAHVKGELECYDVPLDNTIRFVSRTEMNNGCDCYVLNNGLSGIEKANAIAIGDTTATCFYQGEDFVCGDHMVICRADWINLHTALFIISILKQEKYKYSYGRAFKMELISNTMLKLPAADNEPDWNYMEQYIKSLNHNPLTTINKSENVLQLNIENWKEFKVGDFFDIHPTKFIEGVSAGDCVNYGVPLVVNSAENNGIAGLCDMLPTEEGNIVTFSDTTDGNTFFYQPKPFIGFAHVQGMYPKTRKWSKEELLFLSTIMMFDSKGKYSYGRKMRRDIILEIKIKLPVDKTGNPDWQFMKNYIKSLPYGDRI